MGDLSDHFSRYEFACRCGCGADYVDPVLVLVLTRMRQIAGVRIDISSGVRCEAHNRAVGGKNGSEHITGRGADLFCLTGPFRRQLIEAAVLCGVKRIGISEDFIHIGISEDLPESVWLY